MKNAWADKLYEWLLLTPGNLMHPEQCCIRKGSRLVIDYL